MKGLVDSLVESELHRLAALREMLAAAVAALDAMLAPTPAERAHNERVFRNALERRYRLPAANPHAATGGKPF